MFNKYYIDLASLDIKEALSGKGAWHYLAWQEVRQRYRRSLLGPLWITISTAIMIMGIGPIYGYLLNQSIVGYIQYLAISIVIWTFISNSINEGCLALISAEPFIRQIKLPYTSYILKSLTKNLIFLAHNMLIVVVVLIFIPPSNCKTIPLALIGLLIIVGNLFWIILLLSIICARFRDIPQVIGSIVQILFFITPIMWGAEMLGEKFAIAKLNPLYHFVQIFRAPLLGYYPDSMSWIITLGLMICGLLVSFIVFVITRSKISYLL